MNRSPNRQDGLVTHQWIPHFTVARLIVITAMIAIGCTAVPFFPTYVDGAMFLVAVVGISIGVLYQNQEGWILAALVLLFVGSSWITVLSQ